MLSRNKINILHVHQHYLTRGHAHNTINKHLLCESCGYLSGWIVIEPGNVLSQNSTVVLQPDLVDLTLGCRLQERYLNVGHDERPQANSNKRQGNTVDRGEKVLVQDARELSRRICYDEISDRRHVQSIWIGKNCIAADVCQIEHPSDLPEDCRGDGLTDEGVDKVAQQEPEEGEGGTVGYGGNRT